MTVTLQTKSSVPFLCFLKPKREHSGPPEHFFLPFYPSQSIYWYDFPHKRAQVLECVWLQECQKFARASVTKYHRWSGLNNRHFLSPFLEDRSLRSRCWQSWFLQRPLSLLVDGLLIPMSSHGLPSVPVSVWISSSCQDSGHIELGPSLMTSFLP